MKNLICRIVFGKPKKGEKLPTPSPFPLREIECTSFNMWTKEYNVSLKYDKYDCIETCRKLQPVKFIINQY